MATNAEHQRAYRQRVKERLAAAEQAPAPTTSTSREQRMEAALREVLKLHQLDRDSPHGEAVRKAVERGLAP